MSDTAVVTPAQERALDAAVELVARWGVAKTTLGDVAKTANISRATLYRTFPGGKDELFALLAQREVARFLAVATDACDAAPDLATALTDALHAAAQHLAGHGAVRFVLDHEPERAVPVLGFGAMDALLRLIARAVAPHLVRFFPADDRPDADGRPGAVDRPDAADRPGAVDGPSWAVEWCARLFLSGLVNPTAEWDLADRAVCARLVDTYLAPAFPTATTIHLTPPRSDATGHARALPPRRQPRRTSPAAEPDPSTPWETSR